jgi:hypothetical protein
VASLRSRCDATARCCCDFVHEFAVPAATVEEVEEVVVCGSVAAWSSGPGLSTESVIEAHGREQRGGAEEREEREE